MKINFRFLFNVYKKYIKIEPSLKIDKYGTKKRYYNDKSYKENGSAIEYLNGDKEWWLNDKRHRINGPAIDYTNGYKAWYLNGKKHRIDGPAVEYINGYKAWYLNGKKVKEEDVINYNITEREYLEFVINL